MKYIVSLITIIICLISYSNAHAFDRIKIKKISKNSGKRFIISKTNAKKVYIFSNKKLKAIAKVTKCNSKYCLAILQKKAKGFSINLNNIVLETKSYSDPVDIKDKTVKKRPTQKPTAQKEDTDFSYIHAGLGGPFSNALLGGYMQSLSKSWSLNYVAGSIIYPIGNINMQGTTFGAGIYYNSFIGSSLRMSLGYTYNLSSIELDFSNVNTNSTPQNADISSHMIGSNITLSLGKNLLTGLSAGYSLTDIKSSYVVNSTESVTIPFASGLIYIGFFAGYSF